MYSDGLISSICRIQPISYKDSIFSNLIEVRDGSGDLMWSKTYLRPQIYKIIKAIAFKSMKICVTLGLLLYSQKHMK